MRKEKLNPEFEERAIATATNKPKIRKRYVDDTFTILGTDYVDDFLQHLNSQQPTIRFTMEIEKDNTIPVLRRSSHYHQTDIPRRISFFILYESSQRQQGQQPTKNLRRNLN